MGSKLAFSNCSGVPFIFPSLPLLIPEFLKGDKHSHSFFLAAFLAFLGLLNEPLQLRMLRIHPTILVHALGKFVPVLLHFFAHHEHFFSLIDVFFRWFLLNLRVAVVLLRNITVTLLDFFYLLDQPSDNSFLVLDGAFQQQQLLFFSAIKG